MDKIYELQDKLKYTFKDINLLENAICHTSYSHESNGKLKSNERLEFLGDTVLSLAISERIYLKNPEISEGNMSKIRATIICEDSLYKAAKILEYDKYILLGVGEERLGGRDKASILSDMFEAVLAAIYLDSDFNTAKQFVDRVLGKIADEAVLKIGEKDHKTKLQEILQSKSNDKISYEIIDETGPAHKKIYVAVVKLGGKVLGKGEGSSKKDAEQSAASVALSGLK